MDIIICSRYEQDNFVHWINFDWDISKWLVPFVDADKQPCCMSGIYYIKESKVCISGSRTSILPYQGLCSHCPIQCHQSYQWLLTAPQAWWRVGSVHIHHLLIGAGERVEFWCNQPKGESRGGWTVLGSVQEAEGEQEGEGSVRQRRLREEERAAGTDSG